MGEDFRGLSMLNIYLRVIRTGVAQFFSDLKGVFARPRQTLEEISHRHSWGQAIVMLVFILWLGLPGIYFVPATPSSAVASLSLAKGGLTVVVYLCTLYCVMALSQRRGAWRPFLKVVGYTVAPILVCTLIQP
jgi:hypothetical protein